MFTIKQKDDILKKYKEITEGTKPTYEYSMSDIKLASSGMDIDVKNHSKERLCSDIDDAHKNKEYPIVCDDSLTTWGQFSS